MLEILERISRISRLITTESEQAILSRSMSDMDISVQNVKRHSQEIVNLVNALLGYDDGETITVESDTTPRSIRRGATIRATYADKLPTPVRKTGLLARMRRG